MKNKNSTTNLPNPNEAKISSEDKKLKDEEDKVLFFYL